MQLNLQKNENKKIDLIETGACHPACHRAGLSRPQHYNPNNEQDKHMSSHLWKMNWNWNICTLTILKPLNFGQIVSYMLATGGAAGFGITIETKQWLSSILFKDLISLVPEFFLRNSSEPEFAKFLFDQIYGKLYRLFL